MAALRTPGDFDRDYTQDMAILRKPWHIGATIAVIIFAYTVPFWGNAYMVTTGNTIAYTVIALQGLNLLTGYTGQVSLGQAAFMMVGGYASALVTINWGFPIYIAIPFAALSTGVVGLVFGLPSLRVKGFYLAMATLAAQFIIPWISRQTFPELFGGTNGFIEVPVVEVFGFSLGEPAQFFFLSFTVLLITTILTNNIVRSRLGRAFISVRDNDLAAELLGINLFGYKLRAFFLAAMLAGVAGALKAHGQRGVGTEFGYALDDSIIFLGMLVIGGLGTTMGPYMGGIFVILLEDLALWMGGALAEVFPGQAAGLLTSFRPIFFGLILMIFLIYEPRGLTYRWILSKAAWRLRPFSR
ncbi:MAG: branched-chain amino acid ABC transporter permease [Chloroflexota bacterium]